VAQLRRATAAVDAANDNKDRLEAGLGALRAVIRYLHGDRDVLDKLLTKPLALIENAASDARQGAAPEILNHAPADGKKKSSGAWRERVQGTMAFTLELFIAAGTGKEIAAKRIVTVARNLGVRADDGSPVVARQVVSWRYEINRGKAPVEARATFDGLRQMHSELLRRPSNETQPQREKRAAECQARALGAIKALAAIAPRSAPKEARRASAAVKLPGDAALKQ
jgi:hypothetical protein